MTEVVVSVTFSLIALLGAGSFAAIRIMKSAMKLSEDHENRQQLEDLKQRHALEIEELRKQVNHLSEVLIEGESRGYYPQRAITDQGTE